MPHKKNVFLCGEGYSVEQFRFEQTRGGDISICMARNIDDPVKGVKDILIPACEGYKLDIVKNLKWD